VQGGQAWGGGVEIEIQVTCCSLGLPLLPLSSKNNGNPHWPVQQVTITLHCPDQRVTITLYRPGQR